MLFGGDLTGESQFIQKECLPGLYLIPTNSGVFHDSTFFGNEDDSDVDNESHRKSSFYKDLIQTAAIPSWECVYFVRGGYVGAKCANQGKPIKFQVYFINGPAFRNKYEPDMDNEEEDDVYRLSLNDVYPVFQIKHENCSTLSEDITEGCMQKIHEKEYEHYQSHKDSLEPFSRVQQGLYIFCFLLDTLPLSISATPQFEDPTQSISTGLIDFSFNSALKEEDEMGGFQLIKQLLEIHDQL